MKRIVLFDFFGVISCEIAPFWFRRYYCDDEADAVKARLVAPADLGIVSEELMYSEIGATLGISPKKIREEWMEAVKINSELVEYIKKIRERYPVYLLSNACSDFLREILEKNGLYSLFDRIFISSEIKLAKPDADFFRYCVGEIGANASEAVMIDDNTKNLEGARSAGIDGIHFISNADFFEKFERLFDI